MCSISTLSKKSVKAEAAATAATNMSVKGMAIVLAVIFCATIAQGFPMFKGGRCLCVGPGVKAVRVADIEKVSVIYPSNYCDKTEVIITMKTHKRQRCLNPRSKQANIIIKITERMNLLKYQTSKILEKRI
ncbi:PREDICTED: C-X-C motif chemokine 11 [Hipposideros armiger]|uniref:C-X-C motif chemokine n=1 Tax=Hipposideros armiger TaxID=186990 RepID=A0A8B7PTJ6_HIPAR|nr:PREDICTED: C-X-C motif chemokine 11 [Hipposideros armiger]